MSSPDLIVTVDEIQCELLDYSRRIIAVAVGSTHEPGCALAPPRFRVSSFTWGVMPFGDDLRRCRKPCGGVYRCVSCGVWSGWCRGDSWDGGRCPECAVLELGADGIDEDDKSREINRMDVVTAFSICEGRVPPGGETP